MGLTTTDILGATSATYEPAPNVVVQASASPVAAQVGISVVTSLPTGTDGQQVIFVDSTSAPTYAWLLQYSSAASTWIFIGGSPYVQQTSSTGTVASTTYVTPSTTSIGMTVPLTGTYVFDFGAGIQDVTGSDCYRIWGAPNIDGTVSDTQACYVESVGSGDSTSFNPARTLVLSLTATKNITLQFRGVTANSKSILNQFMKLTPVTVS